MRFWGRSSAAILTLAFASQFTAGQVRKSQAQTNVPRRANELTLAGLQPGRDTGSRAQTIYKNWPFEKELQDTQLSWHFPCTALSESLSLDLDSSRKIQVIRLAAGGPESKCEPVGSKVPRSNWQTGQGLRVRDLSSKVVLLYGEPDSRSPSTRDGQPLELLYYAFDWAGADVPQVMEVLCTKEKDGVPGQVIEITLAGPSL
jgi:hypothetical protein